MTNADWRKAKGALDSALIFNAEGEILASNVAPHGQPHVAVTTAGTVEGEHVQNGVVFRGIPFAAPPTGGSRYVPPQPPESWTGVRPCLAFGPGCPQLIGTEVPVLRNMLPASEVRFDAVDASAVPFLAEGAAFALPVAAFIDLAAEKARLAKEVAALAGDIDRTAKKLANPDFVARAPEEVVDENRERLADAEAAKARLSAALKRLEQVG